MKVVVLNQYQGIYMLRHILHDIKDTDTIDSVKNKYYEVYNRTDTDEFILCGNTMKDVFSVLSNHGIK